jgi:transcriptional regulator with XRE-family HTH domain
MTIKELRQMKGLTLAAFAESIGIGMSTLTGYEAGKRQPGAKALAAIKEVYGVDLSNTSSSAEASPAKEKAIEKKAAKKPRAKKQPAPVEAAPVKPEEEKAVEKKAAKKPRAKKQAAPAKETPTKKPAQIIIQSPMGGEITPEDILTKAGNADKIYVRVDQNKLYIVNGDETSSVDLW